MLTETLISIVAPLEGEGGDAVEAFIEETIAQLRDPGGIAGRFDAVPLDDATGRECDYEDPRSGELSPGAHFIRGLPEGGVAVRADQPQLPGVRPPDRRRVPSRSIPDDRLFDP